MNDSLSDNKEKKNLVLIIWGIYKNSKNMELKQKAKIFLIEVYLFRVLIGLIFFIVVYNIVQLMD